MNFTLTESQKSLLHELLDRMERSRSERMVSVRVTSDRFPDYFSDEAPTLVREWEDGVKSLAAHGFVALDPGKGADHHRVARVRLKTESASTIEKALERMTMEECRRRALEELETSSAAFLKWETFLESERERWEGAWYPAQTRSKTLDDRITIYQTLALLQQSGGQDLTWRQFSVRHFADSKKLDPLKREISRLLAIHGWGQMNEPMTEVDQAAVLSSFGIRTKEQLHLLAGPVKLRCANGVVLDGTQWSPFLCVPESMLEHAEIILQPSLSGILTIENEDSFHAWSRSSPRPDWLAIYVGGFPTKSRLNFLKRIRSASTPHYHWGDLDCGGVEIFLFLEKSLELSVTPIGMDPALLLSHSAHAQPLSSAEKSRTKSILQKIGPHHPLSALLEGLLRTGKKLEQESLLPHELGFTWSFP